MDRPEIEVVEVLNYYDGVIEFLARYVERHFESGSPHYRMIYGALAANSSVAADEARTYDLWRLPPRVGPGFDSPEDGWSWVLPEWQISEDELEFAEDDLPKTECPDAGCAASFVGEHQPTQLINHYLKYHGVTI